MMTYHHLNVLIWETGCDSADWLWQAEKHSLRPKDYDDGDSKGKDDSQQSLSIGTECN